MVKQANILLVVLLFVLGFSFPSNAAIKTGSVCREPGKSSIVLGKKYVCLKNGKKMRWKLITEKKTPTPTVTPTPTTSPQPVASGIDGLGERLLDSEPLPLPQSKNIMEGKECSKPSWPLVGYLANGEIGYVICSGPPGFLRFEGNPQFFKTNAKTGAPIISATTPTLTLETRQPHAYIYPYLSSENPKTELSNRSLFSDTTSCRLTEDAGARSNSSMGFPMKKNRIALDDRVVVQVIPVDFPDVRADTQPRDDLADALSAIEKFWERQATKKVDIVIQVPQTYINLSKNVLDFRLNVDYANFAGSRGDAYFEFANEAAAAIDDEIDFSKVDIAIIAGPPAIKDDQIGTFVAQKSYIGDTRVLRTKEKVIENLLIRGGDENRDILNWIHEFGHMFGLTDFGHDGWADVSQNENSRGKGFFDIMTSYRSPELYVWHRFLLGILEENQIDCVNPVNKSTHLIRPVASPGNVLKGVVIPISSTEAVVIESRRRMGYDATLGLDGEGALVYKVDTSVNFGESTGKSSSYVLTPDRTYSRDMRFSSPLKIGESVTYKNIKIAVVETGNYGDVITVEKI